MTLRRRGSGGGRGNLRRLVRRAEGYGSRGRRPPWAGLGGAVRHGRAPGQGRGRWVESRSGVASLYLRRCRQEEGDRWI